MAEKARKVNEANTRFIAAQRAPIFLGSNIPSTIVRKELIDNVEDVVSERKMVATKAVIKLSKNRLVVMDNGDGISTDAGQGEKTSLWMAVAKLFTSSNYNGESESVGNNGVGATISNMTSLSSKYLVFRGPKSYEKNDRTIEYKTKDAGLVKGYVFERGLLKGSRENLEDIQNLKQIELDTFKDMTQEEKDIFLKAYNAVRVDSYNKMSRYFGEKEMLEDVLFGDFLFPKGLDVETMTPRNYEDFGIKIDLKSLKNYINELEPTPDLEFTDENGEIVENPVEGDLVSKPLDYETAKALYDPYFEVGYLVDVLWSDKIRKAFPDRHADVQWLINYAKIRVGELKSAGLIEIYIYDDDDFTKLKEHYAWTNKDYIADGYDETELTGYSGNTRARLRENVTVPVEWIKSWEEQVKDEKAVVRRQGPFKIAFSTKDLSHIPLLVQGAPVTMRGNQTISFPFQIEKQSFNGKIPYSFKYESDEYPNYTGQDKVSIAQPGAEIRLAFQKSGSVYDYYQKKAEEEFLRKEIAEVKSDSFHPALGPIEESELIITEGYSPATGILASRDSYTQAVISLIGKIKNVYDIPLAKALQNQVIKEILGEALGKNYKRVIIATDADVDGLGHIATLLIGLFASFTNLIQDEKLFVVYTPHYIFYNDKKEVMYSEDGSAAPRGWKTRVNKGLGSMEKKDISNFISNKESRTLVKVVWNGNDSKIALDQALNNGGKQWIKTKGE